MRERPEYSGAAQPKNASTLELAEPALDMREKPEYSGAAQPKNASALSLAEPTLDMRERPEYSGASQPKNASALELAEPTLDMRERPEYSGAAQPKNASTLELAEPALDMRERPEYSSAAALSENASSLQLDEPAPSFPEGPDYSGAPSLQENTFLPQLTEPGSLVFVDAESPSVLPGVVEPETDGSIVLVESPFVPPDNIEITMRPAEDRLPPVSPAKMLPPADQVIPPEYQVSPPEYQIAPPGVVWEIDAELRAPAIIYEAPESAPKIALLVPEVIPEPLPPPSASDAIKRIKTLEKGKYYIQLGIFNRKEDIDNALPRLKKNLPLVIQSTGAGGNAALKLMVGPMNEGESNALLVRFKKDGWKDIFIKNDG
jgi:hypothetical protein